MKSGTRNKSAQTALELLEQSFHLLRGAPAALTAQYFLGALPFFLGLLYFWTDMSRSPNAPNRLSLAALVMAFLFFWMKIWQSVFCRNLLAFVSRQEPNFNFGRLWKVALLQVPVQTVGLVALPVYFTVVPAPWLYAFFNHMTVLGDGPSEQFRKNIGIGASQASSWWQQNLFLMGLSLILGLVVFVNLTGGFRFGAEMLRVLFGIESVFTRTPWTLINTTFFLVVFSLTYLCVDPLVKTAYLLRHFYWESISTGDDL